MTRLDTSIVIDRAKSRKPIQENITAITLIEYPKITHYRHFYGEVIFSIKQDYFLAHELRLKLFEMETQAWEPL